MTLSPRARAILASLSLTDAASIARLGWRALRDAGASQSVLDEIHAACAKEGVDLAPDPSPMVWEVDALVRDGDWATVTLTRREAKLKVPMTTREARALRLGDDARVVVRAMRSKE